MNAQNSLWKKSFSSGRRKMRWVIFLLLAGLIALGTTGYLKQAEQLLSTEMLTLSVGSMEFTLYKLLKGGLALVVLLWIAGEISETGEKYLRRLTAIRASNRTLLAKAFQVLVYFLAFMVGLDVLGIDLTAFTVFSGAIGIGIGFGLQKTTSNFISGLILLFEKSVEEDDLIELGDGTLGFVRQTGARYTRLESFDGKEIMIPNEDFITSRVVNWTYSNARGRVEIHVGVAYDSDVDLVQKLLLEAAREHPRCTKDPEPACFMEAFGDNSLNFLLFFWVDDVVEGRLGPQSDVMLAILKKFREHNITIPFPQRDVHFYQAAKNL